MVAKKKQTEMTGTQADRIPVIENAICEWREAIDERMQLGEREVKKRDIVDELMKKHGFTKDKPYIYSDGEERFKAFMPPAGKIHVEFKRIPSKKKKGGDE